MRIKSLCLSIAVVACLSAWAMPEKPQQQQEAQQQQEQQQQEQQKRPTLGPAPAPTLYGPRTSNTADARKLLRVRKIYVERIDNSLGDKLTEGLAKTRRFRIVADAKDADAVVRGTCFDSRRLKSVRSEIYLNDNSGASIWQDRVRVPYNPPPLDGAVNETANVILTHLSESINEAEHK